MKFALAAMLIAASAPVGAVTIVNGDFEASASGTVPAGWGVLPGPEIVVEEGGNYVPCCGVNGSAADLANKFAAFGGGNLPNDSVLFQAFSTIAGVSYTLKFDFGVLGNGAQTLLANVIGVTGGSPLLGTTSITKNANNSLGSTFSTHMIDFVAASALTEIAFNVDPFTTNVDGILDNVSVTAVPEPATWAMMIVGFGMVGGAMRYRRRQSKIAFATA